MLLDKNAPVLRLSRDGKLKSPLELAESSTRSLPIPVSAWVLDGSAPPASGVAGTFPSIDFASDADDIVRATVQVPSDWDGASDFVLNLLWTNEASDAIAEDETVCWAIAWRSKGQGEVYDAGDAGAASVTYTETEDPGTDKEIHKSAITIDHESLTPGGLLGIELRRDVSEDDYSGDARLLGAWLEYQGTKVA